ncbi:HAD-IC family P-type ATPase [Lactococcus formosensis]|uniref:HAD-IC family P-type ATPase n=1 Tax=Lactococcus formosensis TaxID=1281486 RepID=UPI0003051E3A|nr:HAD-IC family P-type ATPase [Lactococcus formosensis]MCH1722613.1 HAD-IC family P-type ATPase [Lactococcus formosensis]MDG6113186.1 HAD-IC family P-type ATPase [Lactococcus formosensis]MDG6114805.1 HAD-IC family P-type ATPase [Lactococcus formosensis]MDG6120955.1 HAD-IC family P-type ATPase [Lactococcus formosensis]MDG6123877.1 HAD-IC family P-type ATPase [Lactococcus formosensis]
MPFKYEGLTQKEVEKRLKSGQVNIAKNESSKTYSQIFASNLLTFFNLINIFLFILVLSVGSHRNALFIIVVAVNAGIGLYQEIKARRLLDKLSLLNTSKVKTFRQGKQVELKQEELVLDDIILLGLGDQIPCDSQIIEGQLEVNEALLTGEADALSKKEGAELFSGSFVTSGTAVARVIHVGKENYIHQLAHEAQKIKKQKRMLRDSLAKVVRIVSFIMVPLGIMLYLKLFYVIDTGHKQAVLGTVAALEGMFPQGLILLTSMALTLGVINLVKQKVLVQELHTIDALARVDVLCLDKTGTITTGEMKVEHIESLAECSEQHIAHVMGNLLENLPDQNVTAQALRRYFASLKDYNVSQVLPFSSERKYSAVEFTEGTFYLGAWQFLFPKGNAVLEQHAQKYAEKGYRVLVLARSKQALDRDRLPEDLTAEALIVISDVLRDDAKQTLAYFKKQGVRCKIISGDDPVTVSAIAKAVSLPDAEQYVDASQIKTDTELEFAVKNFQIFGRVSPQQKKMMVQFLKKQGHTVAMTGDGVNDILAFKEADCSIAMREGSEAAKQTANLILMDNNFSAMPYIVNEGRRVINNLTRTGSLLMVRMMFSIALTVLTLVVGNVYPFEPIQLTVLTAFFVGIPSFFLSFESDFSKVEGSFLQTLFERAFPVGFSIAVGAILIVAIGNALGISHPELAMMTVLFSAWNYVLMQRKIFWPIKRYRLWIFTLTQLSFFVALIVGTDFLNLAWPSPLHFTLLIPFVIATPLVQYLLSKGSVFIFKKL